MCVIYACYKGVPNAEELNAAERNNSHGAGIAWLKEDRSTVFWKKGLEVKEIKSILKKVSPPLLLHFRIASEGPVCDELTHPFPCTPGAELDLEGSAPAVLCHNGTWSSWKSSTMDFVRPRKDLVIPEGPWSDSRAMAYLAGNFGLGVFKFISTFDEKVAILGANVSPSGRHIRILNMSKWTDEAKLGYCRSSFSPMAERSKSTSGYAALGGNFHHVETSPLMGSPPAVAVKDEDALNADATKVLSQEEVQNFLASVVKARRVMVF